MKEIQITVKPGENFTPAGLMQRYARETAGAEFGRGYWGDAQLTIEGRTYRYHHYGITRENGVDVVMLFLLELERYEAINNMCRNCIQLDRECEGSTCQTWTGCIYRERFKEV